MANTQTALLFIFIVAALVVGISGVVWRNGKMLGLSQEAYRWRTIGTFVFLIVWLTVLGGLAASGFFSELMTRLPPPLALALVPSWIIVICCLVVPALRTYLAATPLTWLIGFQTFRVGIEYILWVLYHQDLMPRAMTFEGQNVDLLVGITAPIIAVLVARQRAWTGMLALVWNGAALLILLNTIRVAFQSVPGIFYDPTILPPNTIVGQFPFIWLPSFVVPVALLGHGIALIKTMPMVLRQNDQPSSSAAASS